VVVSRPDEQPVNDRDEGHNQASNDRQSPAGAGLCRKIK
jgi:hypothetical protein